MKFGQQITLRYKIVIPSILLVIIPILTMLLFNQVVFSKWMRDEILKTVKAKHINIEKKINEITKRDIQLATFVASMPSVQKTYNELMDSTGKLNVEKQAENLERTIEKIVSHQAKVHKQNIKIHFHLPPATSFYRTWISKKGDELSTIRQSIMRVAKTHQEMAGIEIGRYGIGIRSIAPILSLQTRKYLGSLEIITPLKDIYDLLKEHENEEFGVFIHKTKFNAVKDKMYLAPDSSITIGEDFYMMEKPSLKFKIPEINTNKLYEFYDSNDNYSLFRRDQTQYALFKFKDINNDVIGIMIFQTNISDYISEMEFIRKAFTIIIFIFLVIGITVMMFISNMLTKPIIGVRKKIDEISKGKLDIIIPKNDDDEITEIYKAMKKLTNGLIKITNFAKEMEKGNFNSDFKPFGTDDTLGNALLEMRENLIKAKNEEEKRIDQDRKMQWTTAGHAKFVEILRHGSQDLESLADHVIKGLVEYLQANQGGLFVLNDLDPRDQYLELVASYAYNQKKHLKKRIDISEGLVGMCAVEKYTIYRKEIPEEYIKIRSGLGSSNPKNLLIVPLQVETDILGVVELASFKIFEQHEIEFVEKIAENIASSLLSVKINTRTEMLLEQSREQADILFAKEMEMRQNIEQMKVIQEDALKKEALAKGFINAVSNTFIEAKFNVDGTIESANRIFYETFQYLSSETEGKHISFMIEDTDKEKFETIWKKTVSGGNYFEGELRFITRYSRIWLYTVICQIKDADGDIEKVLFLGMNIDESKSIRIQRNNLLTAIENSIIKAEYKPDGSIVSQNSLFLETLGFGRSDAQRRNVFDLINEQVKPEFYALWEKVINGTPTAFVEKITTTTNKERFFKGIYAAVPNYEGIIFRVVYVGIEITKEINKLKNDGSIDLSYANDITIFDQKTQR